MFNKLFQTLRNLPVVERKDPILAQLAKGDLVLSAETGSGKSLFTPAAWADQLQKAGTDPRRADERMKAFGTANIIVVCVPRVMLAIENARAVAEIAGVKLGREVGYATGEKDAFTPGVTRIIFVTWGTALARQMVAWGRNFVFDEVHEGQLLCTVTRALIHRRKDHGEDVRILEMSATLNAERQEGYWGKVSKNVVTIHAEGQQYPISERTVSPRQLEQELRDLRISFDSKSFWDVITAYQAVKNVQEGRDGVLIFRPGHAGVQASAAWVEEICVAMGIEPIGAGFVHGGMDAGERREVVDALAKGDIRILAGTQVIESGLNLKGQDCGVTCGKGREMTTNKTTGKKWLDMVDLAQWRLIQMAGRTRRWREGLFTLVSDTKFGERTVETRPEAERIPLEDLVMQCAAYGVRASQLTYDCFVDMDNVRRAETRMQRLGLVDELFQLTPKGQFAQQVPADPEVAASLFQARQEGILRDFLPIVAIMEEGTIRRILSRSLAVRNVTLEERTCEWLVELRAFYEVGCRLELYANGEWDELKLMLGETVAERFDALRTSGTKGDKKKAKLLLFDSLNVSKKKYWGAKEKLGKLFRVMGEYLDEQKGHEKAMTVGAVRRAILAGHINDLFKRYGSQERNIVTSEGNAYEFSKSSPTQMSDELPMAMGELTTITLQGGGKITFLSGVTAVSVTDLTEVFGESPAILKVENTRERIGYFMFQNQNLYTLFGEYVVCEQKVASPLTAEEGAEKAAFEVMRAPLKARLESLNKSRQELGMETIRCGDANWQIGSYGSSREYTEELVADVEARMKTIVLECHAETSALSEARVEVELNAVRYTDDGFKFGSYGETYAYTAEGIAKAKQDNATAIAEKREADAKLARDAEEGKVRIEALNVCRAELDLDPIEVNDGKFVQGWYSYPLHSLDRISRMEEDVQQIAERREAEKAGRDRVAGFNQRLEALGRNALTIDSDGDVSWNGYKSIRDMEHLDVVEEGIAQLEAEAADTERAEAERREAEAKAEAERQEAIARGKARIANLNLRREALDWDELQTWNESFEFDGEYIAYDDEAGIQRAEVEVVAEEKRLEDLRNREVTAADLSALATHFGGGKCNGTHG